MNEKPRYFSVPPQKRKQRAAGASEASEVMAARDKKKRELKPGRNLEINR